MPGRSRRASRAAASPTKRRPGRPERGLWVEVEPGFHVGNERGQFLGSVQAGEGGGFTAFDARSEFLGGFEQLDHAKAAVVAANGAPALTV